jgi:hypothetical protein
LGGERIERIQNLGSKFDVILEGYHVDYKWKNPQIPN